MQNISTMQAIRTRFIAATNTKGRKVSARSAGGSQVILPYNYSLEPEQNHAAAALALIEKLGWTGDYSGGTFGDAIYWTQVVNGDKWATVITVSAEQVAA